MFIMAVIGNFSLEKQILGFSGLIVLSSSIPQILTYSKAVNNPPGTFYKTKKVINLTVTTTHTIYVKIKS